MKVPHLALALTACAALSACTLNVSFDIDQKVPVVTQSGGTATYDWPVDLAQYKEVTEHKNDIRSLDLDSVDITVTTVNAPSNQATTLSGSVSLRKNLTDPPANDVKIGDVMPMPVQAGSTTHLKGNGLVDAFLLQQLQDGGTFTVIMTGTVDKKADFALDVVLHVNLAYDANPL